MRVVATSDFHGTLPEIPNCDLLLIGGDVCPVWNHELKFQADWLRTTFAEWIAAQPATDVVWIAGNHDFVLEEMRREKIDAIGGIYLDNEMTEVQGLKIYGSPYSNRFGGWAFMKGETELGIMWRDIPRDIDILLVHGPPYGFGDAVGKVYVDGGWHDEHAGSTTLANQLNYDVWPHLKMAVYGHIHEGYGEQSLKQIRMLNVSQMNDEYRPVNAPVLIDL